MGYRVIHFFTDLQDFNHAYKVGDEYPRPGIKVSEERIRELSTNKNKQKKPLIEVVSDEPVEITYTKTSINRMPIVDLQSLAKEQGIENSEDMTGSELKKLLIEKFNL